MAETQAPPPVMEQRTPPRWLWRALFMALVVVVVGVLAWNAISMLTHVLTIIFLSWFIALAMEPLIRWLVGRGIRRTRATGLVMTGGLAFMLVIVLLFGNLFVTQLIDLVDSLPTYYAQFAEWLESSFDIVIPTADEAVDTLGDNWQDLAPGLLGAGLSIINGLFTFTSILLVVYYMASAGPRFRAAVLQLFAPNRQRELLGLWELSQEKVADYINSRVVLAALSTFFTFIFLTVLSIPYALPLAAFTGIVSQFVPTIGTYIGGALPVAVALTVSPAKGIAVLAFIIGYQQVENLIFSPKVSARALSLNPAVSFLGVIAFGAIWGPMGAFLALPIIATVQAVAFTYVRRHELVDSPLLREDVEAMRRHRGWVDLDEDRARGEDGPTPAEAAVAEAAAERRAAEETERDEAPGGTTTGDATPLGTTRDGTAPDGTTPNGTEPDEGPRPQP